MSHTASSDVNVVGLKNTTKVGLVRGPGAQPLDRRLLIAESFEEGIRKVLGVKRLIRQLRNGFFYFNGVQLFPLPRSILKVTTSPGICPSRRAPIAFAI